MKTETWSEYELRIIQAVHFVLSNLDDSLTPARIADEIGFSRFHFGRLFSRTLGESFAEFVRRIRLERSAHELCKSSRSISEIAIDAGYDSLEGFGRAFRTAYFVVPTEFRKNPTRVELSTANGIHWSFDSESPNVKFVFIGEPTMKATIVQRPALRVIALRHIGPYHLIGEKFGTLAQWAAQNSIEFTGALGVFYDDPESTAPAELTSDACIIIDDSAVITVELGDAYRIETISGGAYAVATHQGPYSQLGDAWDQFLGSAVPVLGRALAPLPCYELYVNDCSKVPESEVLTELYVPLAPLT